jgi:hypothetical protein
MATSTSNKPSIPESLVDLFVARAKFEEEMLGKIREAHSRDDTSEVMKLVSELLHSGPGTTKKV